jgi:dipeptidyl aminopeptidase/acylaminoacyl peptidase
MRLTSEMLADQLQPSSVCVSPDRRWVAFTVAPFARAGEHPAQAIWLAPADGSEPARQLSAGDCEDASPAWLDARDLLFLSDREERGEAQLYRLSLAGGEARPLTSGAPGVAAFAVLADGVVALVRADAVPEDEQRRLDDRDDPQVEGEEWLRPRRLRLLDVGSGELRTPVGAGERYVAAVAADVDGERLALVTWPTPENDNESGPAEVLVVDRTGVPLGDPSRLEGGVWQLAWGGRRLLALAERTRGGVGGTAVFGIDPTGRDAPALLASPDDACISEIAGSSSTALALVDRGLDTELARLDPISGALTMLERRRGSLGFLAVTPGGSLAAATWDHPERPGEVWAGPPDGEWRCLSELGGALREVESGPRARLGWHAPDGLELDGILFLPPGATPGDGPRPLVTLVHGGPYGRVSDSALARGVLSPLWLASHGYAAFLPNPRGGSGRGPAFAASVVGAVGVADWTDVESGIERLIADGVADPARLAIMGWSQGGFMTAWAIGQTDRFRAGVMGAGVSDWGMMVAESDAPTFEGRLGGSTGWEGPGPHRHDELSPISYAHRVRTPLLILHGERDERVPVSQGRFMARALRAHGTPYELVVYPREPHNVRERAHVLDIHRRVAAWLERWL